LENIVHFGIKDIIITTGPFEDNIKKFVKDNFPNLNVTYIKNPDYNSTNYIYSIWLAKNFVNDNIILLHGDMVFEKKLLGKLLDGKNPNCVLVNNKIDPPEKDFKGKISDNHVKKIGVNVSGENAFFLAPVYKFSKEAFNLWLKEIEKFVKKNNLKVYAEEAFNLISDKIELYPTYYQDEFCMEIDNFDDLKIARNFFRNNEI